MKTGVFKPMNDTGLRRRFQFLIMDAGAHRARERVIGPSTYFFGGDPSRTNDVNYVFLGGSALPLVAFRVDLTDKPEGWRLTALVPDLVEFGNETLEQGERVALASGSRVKVRDASVVCVSPSARNAIRRNTEALSELQLSVHNDLMDFEERQSAIMNLSETERKEKLSDQVNVLLGEITPFLTPSVRENLANEALVQHLELFCLATDDAGSETPVSDYAEISVSERQELKGVMQRMVFELTLSGKPDDTASDLQKIREGFGAVVAQAKVNISGELQLSLIRAAVRDWVMSQRFNMGALELQLKAPIISEVMICSHDRVFVEKVGKVFDTGLRFNSEHEVERIAKRIASNDNKALTMRDPLLDARLDDGSRVNAVLQPTALLGSSITIRKFNSSVFTLGTLRDDRNMLSRAMDRFLRAAVKARRNIVVSGGTGTGKTTLLNALGLVIPYDERIVTIEDTGELKIAHAAEHEEDIGRARNLVSLEARAENFGAPITIRDLLRNALRMRPDRIIVGECRDGAALDMLQAMNTGHDGSMTTAHANSPEELLLRLENLALQGTSNLPARVVRQQIASAIDLVVQVHRTASVDPKERAMGRKQRSIVEIAEVGAFEEHTGEIPIYPIFEMVNQNTDPQFLVSGYVPSFFDDLLEGSDFQINDFFEGVNA